jgi:hypothetical protein
LGDNRGRAEAGGNGATIAVKAVIAFKVKEITTIAPDSASQNKRLRLNIGRFGKVWLAKLCGKVMAQSDPNLVLRRLPIVVGALAGTLLLTNRLLSEGLTPAQSRSDAVGVIVSAVLILTGLLWQQIQPRSPEIIELEGESGFVMDESLPEGLRTELAWATHLLLTNTVTRSVVIYYQEKTILRRGVFGKAAAVVPGAIVKRVLETGNPVYLVALKLYPGRIEFDYLPENTQGVICQPIGNQGVMILGANAPRSYTKQDEAWIAGLADKLSYSLGGNDSNPSKSNR